MSRYARLYTSPIPQSEPLNERQVQNNAGGFVFALSDWDRLERFLILGSDAPTYYQGAKSLTRENAKCVERCYDTDHMRTVNTIAAISTSGRAPKNDAAIFALALGAVHKEEKVRRAALDQLSHVCRTATHLFTFVDTVRKLGRGWGRTLKRAVANWYDKKEVGAVAYQAIKYRSRQGLDHAKMLKLSHPTGGDGDRPRALLYTWMTGNLKPEDEAAGIPSLILAHEAAMKSPDLKTLMGVLEKKMLPWEAIPTKYLNEPAIWRAMLPRMGLTAMIRELARMTSIGVFKPFAEEVNIVVERLTDVEQLRQARIHPFNILVAHAQYQSGRSGQRSVLRQRRAGGEERTWVPVPKIVDALEEAFYKSFTAIEPSGLRTLIGLDVSGSMSSPLMGSPLMVCAGAAAMAMTIMRSEPDWHVFAFDQGFRDLRLKASDNLEAVLKKTQNINGGGTDCALPMLYALKNKLQVDTFQVFTDNETWAGLEHPVAALKRYRDKMSIPAKLIVVGMTSTGFTIADPNDAGMLDVVGFDSDAPSIMADFARK